MHIYCNSTDQSPSFRKIIFHKYHIKLGFALPLSCINCWYSEKQGRVRVSSKEALNQSSLRYKRYKERNLSFGVNFYINILDTVYDIKFIYLYYAFMICDMRYRTQWYEMKWYDVILNTILTISRTPALWSNICSVWSWNSKIGLTGARIKTDPS